LIELTRSSPNEFSSEGLQIHQVASATTSGSSSAISSKGQHADELIESTRSSSSKLPSKGHQPQQVASPATSDSAISTINKGQHTDELIESTRSSPNELSSEEQQKYQVASTIDPYVSPPGSFLRMLQEANFGKMSKKKSPLREHHSKANARRPLPKTPKKSVTFLSDPVTRTKKYIVGEKISFPSPISSVDENSILSIAASLHRSSPTQEEQVAMLEAQMRDYSPTNTMSSRLYESIASYDTQDYNRNASTYTTPTTPSPSGPRHYRSHSSPNESMASEQMPETPTEAADSTPTTPTYDSSSLFEEIAFEELNLSGRRSSLRNAQKAEDARKLRLEKAARKAAERARKEKEQAEEQARKKKAEAEEQARKEAAEAEERKKASRRIPVERVVQPLSVEWESKVTAALAKPLNTAEVAQSVTATPISRRDIGRVLPQAGKDPANGWLNDEVINAYLQAVVEYGHQLRGHKRGQTPKLHAFNPFFWSNLNEFGPEKVSRWAKKAKIGEDTLLSVEHVFIPINRGGNHWTLGVVSPTAKTIEYFDSMHNDATRPISMIRAWLACELRGRYRSEEWIVVEDPAHRGVGKGPSQDNLSDCGVFTVTTAKMVSLGVDPMAVSARDMPLQRKRIVAELLNGGFSGGFEPNVVFA